MLTIADLNLTSRCFNILKSATIYTVDDLCERTPLDLRKLRGFGVGCLREVEKALEQHGRALKGRPVPTVEMEVRQNVGAALDVLRRIVEAWREDEIGQIDGALIEEAEAALGMTAPADPLAAEGAFMSAGGA